MQNVKPKLRIKNFCFGAIIFCFLIYFWGCNQQNNYLSQAQKYAAQAEQLYQQAVGEYKNAILRKENLQNSHFELGKLYYRHREYNLAAEEFLKTDKPQAKKFLAISYYEVGKFSDALEIFNRVELNDEEYLYYYGLTCEKLNLFDRALKAYQKIKGRDYSHSGSERVKVIQGQFNLSRIKDTDSETAKIIFNSPSLKEYPQAGALILFCDEKIEVTPQNTQVSYLHYLIKILNERGKEEFSETQIEYDSTYEKVELDYARTIKPDGSIVTVGSRHIRDVSKYLNFPLYSNVRVLIISFPEIVEGAAIEYKLKVYRSQLINKKDFVASYPAQSGEPIISANFILELPKDRPLHLKVLNEKYNHFGARLEPEIQQKDGRQTYSWQFKNIPQIIPESNMPPGVEINPSLLISTFNSWDEVYQWWWKLSLDKISADKDIKNKVKELTRQAKTPKAKLQAIYNFCAQKIRYVAVAYGEAGYEPHQAADIYRNKYGDCKDQAILLVTMLKEAGFLAYPVLIATKDHYNLNPDFPSVNFNHCIAAVSFEGRVIFLDPTAETCAFGDLPAADQGRRVLLFSEAGYKIMDTPLYAPGHNLLKQQTHLTINPDETISVAKTIFSYGIYDQGQRYWLLYTPPELVEQALKEKIQGFSIGAKLDKYNIDNLGNLNQPAVLRYLFKGEEYFTNAGNLRIMPQLAAIDTSLVAQDKRKYAIDFNILDRKEVILDIAIPDGFAIKYMPADVSEDSPWLSFSLSYKLDGQRISFRQRTELKKNLVTVQDYPAFKVFLQALAKKVKQRIVLEKE